MGYNPSEDNKNSQKPKHLSDAEVSQILADVFGDIKLHGLDAIEFMVFGKFLPGSEYCYQTSLCAETIIFWTNEPEPFDWFNKNYHYIS